MNTSSIYETLNFFYDHADERVRDKLFMGSPYAIYSAYMFYVLFITKILPKFMENRKAANYTKFMTLVDGLLCMRSSYFLVNGAYIWFFLYNWKCQPIDRSDSWEATYVLNLVYQFVVTKFIYTLQSVVFVMSKRKSPVATYLLIHHTIFPLMIWIGANYYPGGHVVFVGFINSIVHFSVTAMRLICYFFPKCFLRDYRKSIDVNLHIFQFLIIIWHAAQLFFLDDCTVPIVYAYIEIICALLIAFIYNYFVINASQRKAKGQQLETLRTC